MTPFLLLATLPCIHFYGKIQLYNSRDTAISVNGLTYIFEVR